MIFPLTLQFAALSSCAAAFTRRAAAQPIQRRFAEVNDVRLHFLVAGQGASEFGAFTKTPLTVPMLVLAGEKVSGDFLINQRRLIPGDVDGVIVPGSGHCLMQEATRPVVTKLDDFISEPVRATAR